MSEHVATSPVEAAEQQASELARLQGLERSVLSMIDMLRHGVWDVSSDTGTAGDLHAAITSLHIELEDEAEARVKLEQRLAGLCAAGGSA